MNAEINCKSSNKFEQNNFGENQKKLLQNEEAFNP